MQRGSKSLLRKYLEARRRSLGERPGAIREFLERLVAVLGNEASIIVFGGRALYGIDADEPRDVDLLVEVEDAEDPSRVEEIVYRLKPKRLPADIIVAWKSELRSAIARRMLEHAVFVSDPLNVKAYITKALQSGASTCKE
jgi:hypothetical protein